MDAKAAKLLELLGSKSNITDMERAYFKSLLDTNGTVDDVKSAYFESLGYTGTIQDMGKQFYIAAGYSGGVADMEKQYWENLSLIVTDPNFADVELLLHFDGAQDSTIITDSSSVARSISAVGDARLNIGNPKFGPTSCILFGTADWLKDNSAASSWGFVNRSTAPWTVEGFIRRAVTPVQAILDNHGASSATAGFNIYVNTSDQLVAAVSKGVTGQLVSKITTTEAITPSDWNHFAYVYDGSVYKVYVNGVASGTDTGVGSPLAVDPTNPLLFGIFTGFTNAFEGYFDEFRITNGVARYTADFTPPTEAFPDS